MVLSHEIKSRHGKVSLRMPGFPTAPGSHMWTHAPEHMEVQKINACMHQCIKACTAFLAAENGKAPTTRGPLGEVHYWRERLEQLNGAYEQLTSDPHVKGCMVRLIEAQKENGSKFQELQNELSKLHAEAKDNVKVSFRYLSSPYFPSL